MGQAEGNQATGFDRRIRVGRDRSGAWLAIDALGQRGGMFRTREAALRFAQSDASAVVVVTSDLIDFV